MIEINSLGKLCPIPVIETKKTIEKASIDETLLVKVDNVIATQNLEKLAKELGLLEGFNIEKINKAHYEVTIKMKEAKEDSGNKTTSDQNLKNIIVINSDTMGDGDEVLGKKLIEGFIYALTESEVAPKTIIFYNKGVNISAGEGKTIEDLKTLENRGTQIVSCGLCLEFYKLSENLKVGEVTNMYSISQLLMSDEKVVYL